MTDYKRFKGPLDSKWYQHTKTLLSLNLDPSRGRRIDSSEGV